MARPTHHCLNVMVVTPSGFAAGASLRPARPPGQDGTSAFTASIRPRMKVDSRHPAAAAVAAFHRGHTHTDLQAARCVCVSWILERRRCRTRVFFFFFSSGICHGNTVQHGWFLARLRFCLGQQQGVSRDHLLPGIGLHGLLWKWPSAPLCIAVRW